MLAVDTNIVVRFLMDDDAHQFAAVQRLFAADEIRMEVYGRLSDQRRRIVRLVNEASDEP